MSCCSNHPVGQQETGSRQRPHALPDPTDNPNTISRKLSQFLCHYFYPIIGDINVATCFFPIFTAVKLNFVDRIVYSANL